MNALAEGFMHAAVHQLVMDVKSGCWEPGDVCCVDSFAELADLRQVACCGTWQCLFLVPDSTAICAYVT